MRKISATLGLLAWGLLPASFAAATDSPVSSTPSDQSGIELPLTGPAYRLADDAYKAYELGDYRRAERQAREAIRLRPDVARLRDLQRKALAALRSPGRAAAPASRAKRRAALPMRNRPEQTAQTAQPAPSPGFHAAEAAYQAYDRQDYPRAIRDARAAVRQMPSNGSYRVLLVNVLMAAKQYQEADLAVTEGIAQFGSSAELETQRNAIQRELAATQPSRDAGFEIGAQAYQAFDAKDYRQAIEKSREAVRLSPGNRDYRLLLMNALLLANRLDEAEQAATAALASGGDDAALLAQRGHIRQRLGKLELAQEDFAAALQIGGIPAGLEIGLLVDSGRKQDARHKFIDGLDSGAFNQLDDLELAYLAARVGEDEIALAAFKRADSAGKLPDTALADAAYSAVRSSRDEQALNYFKRTIDAAGPLRLNMEPQLLFDTRRAVATVARTSGVIASLSHRGAGSALSPAEPGASGSGGLQAGMEAYWRPLGYQNGRTVEVFGRVFETLQDKAGGATGAATAQGTIGARWKPLTDQNLVLSVGRLIPLGSQATSDWLTQAAYSAGHGTDLRVDVSNWWTAQGYGEVGRYFQHPQTYGIASVQVGRSFRLDALDPKLVVFPHLTLNADYNSSNTVKSAIGAGPGVNLRYWFREDGYTAPQSFVDLSLQYRSKLDGDERARGFFMTLTLSY